MIECIEKENELPVCPYCQQKLDALWCSILGSFLGKRYVYFCPHCRKVLGVSHRKGFWMG